ncbi:MAG: UDP-N-acetylglucosamine 2-epimerase (non-hydrolyzing) [Balneola sp.]|nr:MAG: UDP-N-acetylglucosamine 2-epimerase (non-hydrolyzing) [Balneola sp.]
MKKIISIVGARPQFVKLSPLSKILREDFNEIIIHTGQHFDENMSKVFFEELDIPLPDYNLGVGSGNHGWQTAQMLIEIEEVLIKERPDLVIIFGDTNSTLAGILASSKLNIDTVHIEAGLRSYNMEMPEEQNRIVSDHLSNHLFAPSKTAVANLKKEGLYEKAYLTGDIMVDSVLNNVELAKEKSKVVYDLELTPDEYYLVTLHRPYNVDDPDSLKNILSELGKLGHKVIFPVHPRTRKIIEKNKLSIANNIRLINPQGYLDFINLQKNSLKIITDSGGIQKEAYILNKPCITLRSETEWLETVESGWNLLITDAGSSMFSEDITGFQPLGEQEKVYGENVANRMKDIIHDMIA